MSKIKFFTLPYAGGNSSIYYELKESLAQSDIEIISLEYSGHGIRLDEKLNITVQDIVDDIYEQLLEYNIDYDYAILGYSLGSLVLYELYKKLVREKFKLPDHLFFCASCSPDYYSKENKKIDNRNDLLNTLNSYGGMDTQLNNEVEFMEYFLPIMEADLKAICSYHDISPIKIDVNSHIIYSCEEKDIYSWNNYVNNKCDYRKINSGHFFIRDHYIELGDILCEILN